MRSPTDTIAAIATAEGASALGIVRISGPQAIGILGAVVPATRATRKPRRIFAGTARHPQSGEPLDKVLCFTCPGPGTATGEDIAELQGHGGPLIMRRLLSAVLAAGARPAEPGEFTYRAFASGKIDLTQAEAVMALIGARSDRAARVALRQLDGGLGAALNNQFKVLNEIAAQVEAGIDFPDEDLPQSAVNALCARLDGVADRLRHICGSYALGHRLGEGARVAIVGPPNAGKSSLLNRLVEEDRVIVDAAPGTTRDVIEARCEIAGITISFSDTAGVRGGVNRVERAGIEKTHQAARAADLIVIVLDGAEPLPERHAENLRTLLTSVSSKCLVALNKNDLSGWRDDKMPEFLDSAERLSISALNSGGIASLRQRIVRLLVGGDFDETAVLTTERQHKAVSESLGFVERAVFALRNNVALELAAVDLRSARETMAALWGRSATEEMLSALFSQFCIGK